MFDGQESLSRSDPRSRSDAIARIDDDALANGETRRDGGKPTGSPEQGNSPILGAAVDDNKHIPAVALPKKSARRHDGGVLLTEDRDARVDLLRIPRPRHLS